MPWTILLVGCLKRTLHAGFPAMLPRTTSGQQVVHFDCWQIRSIMANAMNGVRCCFFQATILAKDKRAHTKHSSSLVELERGQFRWLIILFHTTQQISTTLVLCDTCTCHSSGLSRVANILHSSRLFLYI
jgi:hypothetical protein